MQERKSQFWREIAGPSPSVQTGNPVPNEPRTEWLGRLAQGIWERGCAAPAELLLVDDEPIIRDGLASLLRHSGYTVATAENGLDALEYLRAIGLPRLIILDLMMPVMDGWEFRRLQRLDSQLASFPVIVLSAALEDRRTLDLSADHYFPKPLHLRGLLDTIAQYVLPTPASTAAMA